jgi:hypothetical protein
MSYPVTGSLVSIRYGGRDIAFGQGLKIEKKIDYQTVRVLGEIYPKTFVISFVTVTGGFTIADHADVAQLQQVIAEIESSVGSSAPSGKTFQIVAAGGSTDAPTYTIEDVKIIDMSTDVDISGQLLTTTVTFIGRKMVESD